MPRLTVHGRTVLVQRVLAGRPGAHVAAELGVSRATGYKWWARYRSEGPAGLADRASRAHRIPGRTATRIEQQILTLRRERKLGPHRIAALVGLSASTVHAVLTRHGLSRLAWMDRVGAGNPVISRDLHVLVERPPSRSRRRMWMAAPECRRVSSTGGR